MPEATSVESKWTNVIREQMKGEHKKTSYTQVEGQKKGVLIHDTLDSVVETVANIEIADEIITDPGGDKGRRSRLQGLPRSLQTAFDPATIIDRTYFELKQEFYSTVPAMYSHRISLGTFDTTTK